MKKFRFYIARFATYLVALQILNMGLFAQEFRPLLANENADDINIINTIDEFVAEVVLGHVNAVPENNDHGKKDLQSHKHIVFKLITISRPSALCEFQINSEKRPSFFNDNYKDDFFKEINPPPPKAA